MPTPKRPRTVMTAFRLPVEMVKRVDLFAAQLQTLRPGETVTRADAVRILLARALDQEEEHHAKA